MSTCIERVTFHHVNFMVVTITLLSGLGKLIPDLKPGTKLTIDLLATNLNLHKSNKSMTKRVSPSNVVRKRSSSSRVDRTNTKSRKLNLQVDVVNKITVTGNRACYTLTEVGGTTEDLLDCFNGEVCRLTL